MVCVEFGSGFGTDVGNYLGKDLLNMFDNKCV